MPGAAAEGAGCIQGAAEGRRADPGLRHVLCAALFSVGGSVSGTGVGVVSSCGGMLAHCLCAVVPLPLLLQQWACCWWSVCARRARLTRS